MGQTRASRSSLSAGTPDSLSDNESSFKIGSARKTITPYRSAITPGECALFRHACALERRIRALLFVETKQIYIIVVLFVYQIVNTTLVSGGSRPSSRPTSRPASRPTSRPGSRPASRQGSKPPSRYGSTQSLDSTGRRPTEWISFALNSISSAVRDARNEY